MDVNPLLYRYKTILLTSSGDQYDISGLIEDLGWEEQEKELAARISFSAKNDKLSKGRLSALAKPGCYAILQYSYNGKNTAEAMRGKIEEWTLSSKLSEETLKIKGFDELKDLQESKDNVYYSTGIKTKSAISKLCSKWKIPVQTYSGPNVTHGKLKYDKEKLGSIITKILEEAQKKGGGKGFLRAVKGKVQVLKYGSNKVIYHFEEAGNLTSVSYKVSLSGMITRVKVLGEADDDERRPLEATVDGKTEFGVRQDIYTRGNDESLDEAKKAAKEILEEDGDPEKEIKVKALDVPAVRKGDTIHMKTSSVGTGYFHVVSIVHDCDKMEMTMTLKATSKPQAEKEKKEGKKKKDYDVGDIVDFHGGKHYVSSDASSGYSVGAGKAKITYKNPGSKHPWHLETENWSKSHVYGWVDEGTFD